MLWLALCVGVTAVLLALLALWVPVTTTCNLQCRAEPSGSWAIAFGVGLGPLALTAIAAAGVTPFMTCHVFGKQLARLPLSRWLVRGKKSPPESAEQPKSAAQLSRAERAIARFLRGLDPVDMLLSWWEKERVFEVSSLEIDVEYSFQDVALTGQILAGLYMLTGVLPERFVIHQTPSWEFEDRLALTADGRFRIWLGRLLVDVMQFVLRQSHQVRQRAVPASE